MIRSYLYISSTKVESVLAQAETRGPRPRISKVDVKVATFELPATDEVGPREQRLHMAEQALAADGLIVDEGEAREAQYFYGSMPMRWGHVQCDWGAVGPQPTVMFIGRHAGRQVALFGSLAHVIGFESVEGSTTGSYGFVLWELVAARLNSYEPGLVQRDYPGIAHGRVLLDRWSEEDRQREAHATLRIVHDRMYHEGQFEFLAIVHRRFDCGRELEYGEQGRWVIGSPLFVAWSTPVAPVAPPDDSHRLARGT